MIENMLTNFAVMGMIIEQPVLSENQIQDTLKMTSI